MIKALIQAVISLAVAVVTFIGGLMLCQFFIPDTGVKYINQRGEVVVGGLIIFATLALALLAQFRRIVLFITAGLVPTFIIGVRCLLPGSPESPGIYWPGLLRDTMYVCRHTALPILLSATIVFLIRTMGAQRNAAPNGGPGTQPANSVTKGPPSAS